MDEGSCKGHVSLMSFIKSNITDRYDCVMPGDMLPSSSIDQGSIPAQVKPKTKIAFAASLQSMQH